MKEESNQPKQRGGKREGAGKKKTCGKPFLFKPDLDLEQFLLSQENRNRFINDCIRKQKPEN